MDGCSWIIKQINEGDVGNYKPSVAEVISDSMCVTGMNHTTKVNNTFVKATLLLLQDLIQHLTPLPMFCTILWPILLLTNAYKLRLMNWATMSWIVPHKCIFHISMLFCRLFWSKYPIFILRMPCSHESLRLLPAILSGVQRAVEKGTGGRMAGSMWVF